MIGLSFFDYVFSPYFVNILLLFLEIFYFPSVHLTLQFYSSLYGFKLYIFQNSCFYVLYSTYHFINTWYIMEFSLRSEWPYRKGYTNIIKSSIRLYKDALSVSINGMMFELRARAVELSHLPLEDAHRSVKNDFLKFFFKRCYWKWVHLRRSFYFPSVR